MARGRNAERFAIVELNGLDEQQLVYPPEPFPKVLHGEVRPWAIRDQ